MFFSPTKLPQYFQKRQDIAAQLRSHYEACELPRGGELYPFYFPGVLSIQLMRSRESRHVEREYYHMGHNTLYESVSTVFADEFDSYVLYGQERFEYRADGTDLLIVVTNQSKEEISERLIRLLTEDPRVVSWNVKPFEKGRVDEVLYKMFDL